MGPIFKGQESKKRIGNPSTWFIQDITGDDIMQRKSCAFACHKGTWRGKRLGYTRSSPRQQIQVMVSFTPPLLLLEYAQNRKLCWPQGWGGSFENG